MIFFRRNVSLFLCIVLCICLAGCAAITPDAPPPPDSSVTPLFWRVTSPGGQTLYLFGSIHAADETAYPLPDVVMDAFGRSDHLAVEVDMVAFENDMEAIMAMSMAMLYLDGRTIRDDIGGLFGKAMAFMHRIEAELELDGMPASILEHFRPAMWTNLLTQVTLGRSGLSAEQGLDAFFLRKAYTRGMGILEVESWEGQIEMMLGYSPALQIHLLESMIDTFDESVSALLTLYEHWKLGDEQFMTQHLLDPCYGCDSDCMPIELQEEYYTALLLQRDRHMAAMARQYMAEGKTVFYVVGLAHMLGDQGIIALLRHEGYAVERLSP
jgi:hypothetical protein